MIDLDELWIGDLVLLKKSKRVGKYQGKRGAKAVVNIDGKTVLTVPKNLLAYEPPEDSVELSFDEPIRKVNPRPDRVLDLHIETLEPSLTHALPERIVSYQVAAAKHLIEAAIEHKYLTIELIHGKGKGVLKSEVRHLLSLYDEVRASFEKNQGGSTEVWFQWTA